MHIREPRDFDGVRSERQARLQRRHLRKLWTVTFVVTLVVVLIAGGLYARPLPAMPAKTVTPNALANKVALQWPAAGQSAIGIEGQGVLATSGTQEPSPTASVAKVMTALAVLKKHPLTAGQTGPTITMTQADVDRYNNYVGQGGSAMVVQVGEQLTEYQMLQAALLPSANNIADSLAVWAYGSMDSYHAAANQIAQSLGMVHSTFASDASGFLPETVSTAHDLVLLGQAAIQEPAIKDIVGQTSAPMPIVGSVRNVNVMLGTGGIIGLKTGNTEQAGGCFLFAAERKIADGQTVTAVGVIMAAPTLGQALTATPPLLDSFYNGFTTSVVVPKGTVVAHYQVPWTGQTIDAVTATDTSLLNWSGSKPSYVVTAKALTAPLSAQMTAATLTAKSSYAQTSTPAVLTAAIPAPTWQWRIWRH